MYNHYRFRRNIVQCANGRGFGTVIGFWGQLSVFVQPELSVFVRSEFSICLELNAVFASSVLYTGNLGVGRTVIFALQLALWKVKFADGCRVGHVKVIPSDLCPRTLQCIYHIY